MAAASNQKLTTRVIGLKTLRGVITSPALRATDAKPYLQRIVPALLDNITDPTVDTIDHRTSNRYSMKIDNLDESELNLLGLQCLRDLLRESSALHVKVAVSSMFRCLDEKQIWDQQDYIVSLFNVVMDATQAQNRFVCLSEILRQLDVADVDATTKKHTLAKVLGSLLNQDRTFVGVAVLELLNSLVHHVVVSLAHRNTPQANEKDELIAQELTRCIGK
jgi:hypothetical protein